MKRLLIARFVEIEIEVEITSPPGEARRAEIEAADELVSELVRTARGTHEGVDWRLVDRGYQGRLRWQEEGE